MEYNRRERNSSIEILRIIAAIGVFVLHYNYSEMGGALKYVNDGSLGQRYLLLTSAAFTCAVNLFVMISGYFLSVTQKRRFIKIVEIIMQVIVFQIVAYILAVIFGKQANSIHGVILSILPANYFVILYAALYCISPYINVLINSLSKNNFTRLVMLLFVLFSIWTITTDLFGNIFGQIRGLSTVGINGDQAGYTIVNFVLVYIIGAYIRQNNINITKRKSEIGIIICVALIYIEDFLGVAVYNSSLAWNYNNPLVILLPVFLILLFTNLQFESKIINELAKAAFTCYLFHGYFMSMLGIEKFVNGNIFILILHQFGSAVLIYLASYVVYKIYNFLAKPIIKWLAPKCEKIDISL